jgi:hypothetical protein
MGMGMGMGMCMGTGMDIDMGMDMDMGMGMGMGMGVETWTREGHRREYAPYFITKARNFLSIIHVPKRAL